MKQVASPSKKEFISLSPEDTVQLGKKIGHLLKPGSIVAIRGRLGSGKTVLARGIAQSLGITEMVTSPSYTIISEYEGTIPLYHMDAYRLSGDQDFRLTGAEELLYGRGVSVVEWPERINLPPSDVTVEIEIMEDGKRRILYNDLT
ncbi:MAG: tRNA (adenosine(37)-N6)-threonylcarbamoyltransferase complex ATPase subunit type 1 TsaE [Treponema sp.]|jgi:tRNA threonylcarbamoyladenosine biosynthesis protein TsaE|nr:tRNA (adenosine(37)-N6)-threonylcarbamoyltransferase complex ATPase subunit type 1 TsaE [Treponema sp.]